MSETTNSSPPSVDAATAGIALKVGIQFVKQYYKILSTQPEMVERFYAAPDSSYLSHGEGSEPTNPVPLEECKKNDHANHLSAGRWGCSDSEKMLFELEDGAIDAQPSTNDGILLVVTACVIFKGSSKSKSKGGDDADNAAETDGTRRKKFVQTFFLAKFGRNFSVINDILRFLVAEQQPTPSPVVDADISKSNNINTESVSTTDDAATAEKNVGVETDPIVQEEKKTTTTESAESSSSVSKQEIPTTNDAEDEAPGGGVEESKEEAPDEDEEAVATPTTPVDGAKKVAQTTTKDGKSKKNKGGSKNQQPQQPPPSKPAPGSWASLVVSGGSAPNTPSRNSAQSEKKNRTTTKPPLPPVDIKDTDSKENETSASKEATGQGGSGSNNQNKTTTSNNSNNASSSNTKNNSGCGAGASSNVKTSTKSQQQQRTKRDPDNTLVIKNLSDNIKEHDIINMFQPYAVPTKSKIVGTNLNHHRSLAFVDYDCVAPVLAALKKHAETPFEWNGKILEVDQKTLEQRARRKAGLSNNNSNSNNNNGYRSGGGSGSGNAGRGGGGGSDQYNRRSSGGGSSGGGSGSGGDRGGRRRGTRAGR